MEGEFAFMEFPHVVNQCKSDSLTFLKFAAPMTFRPCQQRTTTTNKTRVKIEESCLGKYGRKWISQVLQQHLMS